MVFCGLTIICQGRNIIGPQALSNCYWYYVFAWARPGCIQTSNGYAYSIWVRFPKRTFVRITCPWSVLYGCMNMCLQVSLRPRCMHASMSYGCILLLAVTGDQHWMYMSSYIFEFNLSSLALLSVASYPCSDVRTYPRWKNLHMLLGTWDCTTKLRKCTNCILEIGIIFISFLNFIELTLISRWPAPISVR